MKKLIRNAIWSILVFFGILISVAYLNGSFVSIKGILLDPINWIVIVVVIAASSSIRIRRRRREKSVNQ